MGDVEDASRRVSALDRAHPGVLGLAFVVLVVAVWFAFAPFAGGGAECRGFGGATAWKLWSEGETRQALDEGRDLARQMADTSDQLAGDAAELRQGTAALDRVADSCSNAAGDRLVYATILGTGGVVLLIAGLLMRSNATKRCASCEARIPATAAVCSKCGRDQPDDDGDEWVAT